MSATAHPARAERSSGLVIAIASLLMFALMLHHPTVRSHGAAGFVEELGRKQSLNAFVHGAGVLLVLTLLVGFWGFAARLGLHRLVVRAGLVLYAAGSLGFLGAAAINGFVVPGYASIYAGGSEEELREMVHVLRLTTECMQVLDLSGMLLAALAILSWSLFLVTRTGLSRATGALGIGAAALAALGVASGHLGTDLHGLLAYLVLQVLWNLMASALLLRKTGD